MIDQTIGNYKVLRLIGEGGMAAVYEVEHLTLGNKAAIKFLNPLLSANAQIRERFTNEAKLMANLNHPNITKVIDFDDKQDNLFIVMEFLEGEDLNVKIKKNGALSEAQTKLIFKQILSACKYAHDKGIVHRDIKPSNIFVLPDCSIKILDFGIAKLFGQGNEMTQTGTQIGTPIYMSPEQVKADKSIDLRSDIYSIGVTLYFASSGHAPYNSETTSQFDVFSKIVYEPLPTLTSNTLLNDVISKACQKDREQRFQSCQEFMDAMNIDSGIEINNQPNVVSENTPPPPKKSNKKKPLIIGGLLFIGLIGLITLGVFVMRFFGSNVYEGDFKTWTNSDTQVYGLVPLSDHRNRDYCKITQVAEGVTKIEEFNECDILNKTTILKYIDGKLQSISTTDQNAFNYKNQIFTSLTDGLEEIEKNRGVNTNLPSKSMVHTFENGLLIESNYKNFDGTIGVGPGGYSKIKYVRFDDENRWGLEKEETYFDESGNPTQYGNIHKIIYERDERGNIIQKSFWDINNKPILNDLNVHLIKYTYDALDNETEEGYYGISDEAIINGYGIGSIRYAYQDGKCISETRYTTVGVIATASTLEALDKASVIKYEYDVRGNLILTTYFNESNAITRTTSGYAKIARQFDNHDNCTKNEYMDEYGNRIEDDLGVHCYVYTYDQFGRRISISFFNKFLEPTQETFTYYMSKNKYEESGLLSSRSYWRNNDSKMTRWSGEHEVNYKYNDQGQELESYYLDEEGSLKKTAFGSSRVVTKYDRLARVTSVAYFDNEIPSSVLRTSVAGYHSINYKYNNENKLISIEYLDETYTQTNAVVSRYGQVSRVELLYKGNKISEQKWYLSDSDIPIKVLDCFNSECMTTGGLVMRFLHK